MPGQRKPNEAETSCDLLVYCGLDGQNSVLFAPLIREAYGRTASVHMHRMKNGYYTRVDGENVMAEKGPGWYADAMVQMSTERATSIILWCKTNQALQAKVAARLLRDHGIRARFYNLVSRVGVGKDNRVRIDGLLANDGWWV